MYTLRIFQSRKQLHNHMSIHPSPEPLNSLKSSSFIIQPSSFTFFIHPSFILRLLSFTACYLSFLYQNYKIYILPIQFLCNTFLHLILYILSCRFRGGKIIERAKNRKILNFNSILLLLCCRNDKNAIWFICIFHSIL